ncbi:MAG: RagB/SusD family nutrient uptake outer membrane protein [Sphingobacteriales bacterium]|nr:RagB/SusD family nutrient uptake outer membrane protein [Sphingobacteriales bacterium]
MKKNIFNKYYFIGFLATLMAINTGCNKFLDRAPLDKVTPDKFLNSESDLQAYTIAAYSFPTHDGWGVGTFGIDNHTDNQATTNYSNRWVPGEWRVPQSGGNWGFGNIRNINYFFEAVLPKWKDNKIAGNSDRINHYIGEAYFLRAYEYFNKLKAFGDFPILKTTLTDQLNVLIDASKRKPQNEVARFIISDLDSAISLLAAAPPNGKNRISKNSALLFKSRVALYEGSWLKFHQGTAAVPGGSGWPGAASNPGLTINIAGEIDYFLTQAMSAAAQVADNVALVTNTKDNGYNSSTNPYFTMFGDPNLEGYSEVLFWRAYDPKKSINHNVNAYLNPNGGNTGYTKGLVNSFVIANGLPIYAAGSGYLGDDSVQIVKNGRDNRLALFMKAPGELRFSDGAIELEGYPAIISNAIENKYVTGYPLKKGFSYKRSQVDGLQGETGSIVFRAVEAYLNYIEASYLKTGSIDTKADGYWKAIRNRAGVNSDYSITVAATDMTEEAKNDFGAYSKGALLTDKILYNIRRERRDELIAEGFRMDDLRRWRALDQLKANPYLIEGFKVWGPMQNWYKNADGSSRLVEAGNNGANVSKKSESNYLRPYRINLGAGNLALNGYKWADAHYFEPIAIQHLLITSPNGSDAAASVIYQNPYWPIQPNLGATQ